MVNTTEYMIMRNGASYRIDYQGYYYGGSGALDYYAISRGSMMLPQGEAGSPGYLAWTNNTGSAGDHAHRGTRFEPGAGNLCAGYRASDGLMIDFIAFGGEHFHSVSAAHKINAAGSNSAIDNHAEVGTPTTPKLTPVFYADSTAVSKHYQQYNAGNYLELKLENIPQAAGYSPMVEITLEIIGNNHKVWFWQSDTGTWEEQPVVGVLGDSIVEAVDLGDKLYFGTTQEPYGSQYRFIWTEKRGYHNYGIGGELTSQIKSRMQLSGGDIALKRTGTYESKGFTHVIINGGINDCIRKVLYDIGKKYAAETYDSSWVFQPVENITAMVDMIKSATARTIKPIVLVSPPINADMYYQKSGSTIAISDVNGGNNSTMTLEQWQSIAALWEATKNQLLSYCNDNGIQVINWYDLMKNKTQYSFDGIHPNIRGYMMLADYVNLD
jgi:lysophospholipase L1-like esterase